MFRHYLNYFSTKNINWTDFLINKFSKVSAKHITNCHQLFSKIIRRFVIFRLRIMNKKSIKNTKRYDSKSIAVHTIFK